MDQMLPLMVKGVPMIGQNHEKFTDPARYQYRKMRGRITPPDPDLRSNRNYEDKGYVLRKRSEVGSDEEIVEVVRHRGERLPRRPGLPRLSSSMDDIRNKQMVPYRGGRGRGADASDSEGSVPPRSRVSRAKSRGRAKSTNGKPKSRNRSSSASSSSLCSSTEDDKKVRKLSRKKWITAGLAGVATVHAASKVYSSIEAHDKRIVGVQKGEISPDEAHKKQRAARWQDAAAIAIAALGIKGAISEWNETMDEHHQHQQLLREKEEHHKKRLERERRQKAKNEGYGGYYKGRDGNWYYDGREGQGSRQRGKSRSNSMPASRPKSRSKQKLLAGAGAGAGVGIGGDHYEDWLEMGAEGLEKAAEGV